jgi:chemotaxis protein methyltransferase WspC
VVSIARERWLANPLQANLRLVSLPCSTGEEPYSMAMALIDAGFPIDRFSIDAVDISAKSLGHAAHGVYGKNSFRGADTSFRDRHFVQTPGGWSVNDAVRRTVRFRQGNLFDVESLLAADTYHAVFCRNVLIYFDPEAQGRAIALLARLLAKDGTLFVGPAETNLLLNRGFVSSKIPLAFAFRKGAVEKPVVKPAPARAAPVVTPRLVIPPVKRTAPVAKPAPAKRIAANGADIEDIRRLADQGRLDEAAARCAAYLKEAEPSPEAWHLYGLIRDAAGALGEAAGHYRKALYLDPQHQQSLIHLALLLERQGDKAGAKRINDRVLRLDRQGRAQLR